MRGDNVCFLLTTPTLPSVVVQRRYVMCLYDTPAARMFLLSKRWSCWYILLCDGGKKGWSAADSGLGYCQQADLSYSAPFHSAFILPPPPPPSPSVFKHKSCFSISAGSPLLSASVSVAVHSMTCIRTLLCVLLSLESNNATFTVTNHSVLKWANSYFI